MNCAIENCQNRAEVVCLCSNIHICSSHAMSHMMTAGHHQIEKLYIDTSKATSSEIIKSLFKLYNQIESEIVSSKQKASDLIKKIYLDLNETHENLKKIQIFCIEKMRIVSTCKVKKISEEYFDKLMQKLPNEVLSESANWHLPEIEFHLKSTEKVISMNEYELPFPPKSTQAYQDLCTRLRGLNNKIMLQVYGKDLKTDPESMQNLLKIVKNSAKDPTISEISSKAFLLLSKLGFDFSGMNLQGIQIPNSEITGGRFTKTDFQFSNFRQVKMNFAILESAILNFKVLKSIEDGKRKMQGNLKPVSYLKFSIDSRIMISGSEDGTIRVWETSSGHCLQILEGHMDMILSIDISDDTLEIVSGGNDGLIKLWDVSTGGCLMNYSEKIGTGIGHTSCVGLTKDKDLILAGTWNKEIFIWMKDGTLINKLVFNSAVWCMALPECKNEDGSWNLLVGQRHGELVLAKTSIEKFLWFQKDAHVQWISSVALSMNSNLLLSTGADSLIKIWVGNKKGGIGKMFYSLNYQIKKTISGHKGGIIGLFMANSFRNFITVGIDQKVKFWDRKKGTEVKNYNHVEQIKAFDVSRDGSLIALSSNTEIIFGETRKIFKII